METKDRRPFFNTLGMVTRDILPSHEEEVYSSLAKRELFRAISNIVEYDEETELDSRLSARQIADQCLDPKVAAWIVRNCRKDGELERLGALKHWDENASRYFLTMTLEYHLTAYREMVEKWRIKDAIFHLSPVEAESMEQKATECVQLQDWINRLTARMPEK